MLEELPFPFPLELELEEKPQASSSGSLMVLEEGAATRLRESPPVEVIACISVGCELRIGVVLVSRSFTSLLGLPYNSSRKKRKGGMRR